MPSKHSGMVLLLLQALKWNLRMKGEFSKAWFSNLSLLRASPQGFFKSQIFGSHNPPLPSPGVSDSVHPPLCPYPLSDSVSPEQDPRSYILNKSLGDANIAGLGNNVFKNHCSREGKLPSVYFCVGALPCDHLMLQVFSSKVLQKESVLTALN